MIGEGKFEIIIRSPDWSPVPDNQNSSLGLVPVSIIDVWDQIITQINIKVIWSQLFEMGLWDRSQFPLFMSGTR